MALGANLNLEFSCECFFQIANLVTRLFYGERRKINALLPFRFYNKKSPGNEVVRSPLVRGWTLNYSTVMLCQHYNFNLVLSQFKITITSNFRSFCDRKQSNSIEIIEFNRTQSNVIEYNRINWIIKKM